MLSGTWSLYYDVHDMLYSLEKKEEDPFEGFMAALPVAVVAAEELS